MYFREKNSNRIGRNPVIASKYRYRYVHHPLVQKMVRIEVGRFKNGHLDIEGYVSCDLKTFKDLYKRIHTKDLGLFLLAVT
jgi:hypothetical protein